MIFKPKTNKSFLELSEHDFQQRIVFIALLILSGGVFFVFLLPLTEILIQNFLSGEVRNSGEMVEYSLQQALPLIETSYYFHWAVDLYVKTPDWARYWFNPTLALVLPSILFGAFFAITITILLPENIGFMSRKIEREIISVVHRYSYLRCGYYSKKEEDLLSSEIINTSLRELNEMAEELGIPLEDLKILKKALIWRNSRFIGRLLKINDGFRMYMRMHFTVKYSNTVLGMVYIGAAVLIVIIGLRGLKLVPSTQPSIILFALSLEFCFLILYAITVIYSKEEDESDKDSHQKPKIEQSLSNGSLGSAKEIERMLRVFLKSGKK